jgi:uncharacterized protein (TIGR03000 family)
MTRRTAAPVLALAALALLALPAARAGDEKPDPKKPDAKPPDAKKAETKEAVIRVLIPVSASLTIDRTQTRQTGSERRFVTPPLRTDRKFTYTLTATWDDFGLSVKRMAVATVRGGKETVVDLRPGSPDASSSQVIYVPTAQQVVDKMLELARVTDKDTVFDLGCGDGRLVVTAAKKYGAGGVGIDIDPERVKESRANVRKAKVGKLVEIRQGDALKVPDLSRATVVVTYMLPEFMRKLEPILREQLKPGTRIVAHDFPLPNWKPQRRVQIPGLTGLHSHTLYVWTVPERKDD